MKNLFISALVILTSSSAFGSETDSSFAILDSNKDGAISKAEAKVSPTITKQWDSLDRNNDQQIDKTEFAQLSKLTK